MTLSLLLFAKFEPSVPVYTHAYASCVCERQDLLGVSLPEPEYVCLLSVFRVNSYVCKCGVLVNVEESAREPMGGSVCV